MKYPLFHLSAIILVTVMLSCCQKKELYHPDKLQVYALDNTGCIKVSSSVVAVECFSASQLDICDSLLIISTSDKNGFIKVFNTNTQSIVAGICQEGRACNEFIHAHTYGFFSHIHGDILLDVLDMKLVKRINLTQSIENDMTVLNDSFEYQGIFRQIPVFADSAIVFAKQLVSYTDIRDRDFTVPSYSTRKGTVSPYSRIMNNLDVPSLSTLIYDGVLGVSPDASVAVEALMYTDCINLVDLHSSRILGIVGKESISLEQIEAMSIEEAETQLRYNYTDIQTFDDCFILLWDGGLVVDGSSGKCEVRVFDWKGNLTNRILLDVNAIDFAYDRPSRKLYLLDENETIYSAPLTINLTD